MTEYNKPPWEAVSRGLVQTKQGKFIAQCYNGDAIEAEDNARLIIDSVNNAKRYEEVLEKIDKLNIMTDSVGEDWEDLFDIAKEIRNIRNASKEEKDDD